MGPAFTGNDEELSINCGRISKNEVTNAVRKLKKEKASDGDNISLRF